MRQRSANSPIIYKCSVLYGTELLVIHAAFGVHEVFFFGTNQDHNLHGMLLVKKSKRSDIYSSNISPKFARQDYTRITQQRIIDN